MKNIMFLFAGQDRHIIDFIAKLITQLKLPLNIIYDRDIHYGDTLTDSIKEMIRSASICICILSMDFIMNDTCTQELIYTIEHKIPLIPIFKIHPGIMYAFRYPYPQICSYLGLDISNPTEEMPTNIVHKLRRYCQPLCRL